MDGASGVNMPIAWDVWLSLVFGNAVGFGEGAIENTTIGTLIRAFSSYGNSDSHANDSQHFGAQAKSDGHGRGRRGLPGRDSESQ